MANNDETPRYEDVDDMVSRNEPENQPNLSTALEVFCESVELIIQTVNRIERVAVLDLVTCPQLDLASGQNPPAKPVTLHYKELRIVLGMFAGRKCAVIQTNMGRECAIEVKKTLHKCPKARVITAVGVAYALNPTKVKLGDVLCSSSIYAFGNMKIDDGKLFPRDDSLRHYRIPQQLLVAFKQENWAAQRNFPCARIKGATRRSEVHFGSMIGWETLLNDQEVRDELRRKYNEAIGGEMEGVELVHIHEEQAAVYERQIDIVVIKGVADFADGKKNDDWQLTAAMAAANYTKYCLEKRDGPLIQGSGVPQSKSSTVTQQQVSVVYPTNVGTHQSHSSGVPQLESRTVTCHILPGPSSSGVTGAVTKALPDIWDEKPELLDGFHLLEPMTHEWEKLSRELKIPANKAAEIRRDEARKIGDPIEACLQYWLQAYSVKPVSWRKLYDIARKIKWEEVAENIEDFVEKKSVKLDF